MRLEDLVSQNYNKLNDNDRHIWVYILRHKEACKTMSIHQLAAACNLSHTTILRFTQKLGLEGYSELKIWLKWADKENIGINQTEVDACYQDIIQTLSYLKGRDCSDIFKLIDRSNRVFIYGSGQVQRNAAEELKRSFLFLDKQFHNLEGGMEIQILLDYVKGDDIFFLLSHSGENESMLDVAAKLKQKGCKTIAITRVGNNSLSRLCDIHLSFFNHLIRVDSWGNELYMTSHFFLINELLMLKYMEYINKTV